MKNDAKNTSILDKPVKGVDLTDITNWEKDYPIGGFNNTIKDIYELPGIDDMAGVILRGRFKNERSLNAHLRLLRRHEKFGDIEHKKMLRAKIAGSAAIGGVRSLEALFGAIQVVASDMYRAVLGLPKLKKGEEEKMIRGSDIRRDDNKGPDIGLGAQNK